MKQIRTVVGIIAYVLEKLVQAIVTLIVYGLMLFGCLLSILSISGILMMAFSILGQFGFSRLSIGEEPKDLIGIFAISLGLGFFGWICIQIGRWIWDKLCKAKEKEQALQQQQKTTRTYTGGYGYGGYSSGYSYNRTLHDELDAASHAIGLRETYGPDWAGYDPEAAGPNPDVYYSPPGYDPEAYSGDIY